MLPRSGITNHQQIFSNLRVQHELIVEPYQKYCCHIMQSTELAENHSVCWNLLKEFWRGNVYPHRHYNWSGIKQVINITWAKTLKFSVNYFKVSKPQHSGWTLIDVKNLLDFFSPKIRQIRKGKQIGKPSSLGNWAIKLGEKSKIFNKKAQFFKLPKSSLLFWNMSASPIRTISSSMPHSDLQLSMLNNSPEGMKEKAESFNFSYKNIFSHWINSDVSVNEWYLLHISH